MGVWLGRHVLAHLCCSASSGEGCRLAKVWSWLQLALAIQVPNTHAKGSCIGATDCTGTWVAALAPLA